MVDLERSAALGQLAGDVEIATKKAVSGVDHRENTGLINKRIAQIRGRPAESYNLASRGVVGLNANTALAEKPWTPNVVPLVAIAFPTTLFQVLLALWPYTPFVLPVAGEALALTPVPPVLKLVPATPLTWPVAAPAYPVTPAAPSRC
jgi:hypothetical protein